MPERILVPVDDSEEARQAFRFAIEEYGPADATVTVVHVVNPVDMAYVTEPGVWDETMIEQRRERAQELLDELVGHGDDHDVDVDSVLLTGSPANEIVDYAEEHDVDHIVIGSRGRTGMSRVLLGSVAEVVVRRAPVPVTVVR